MAAVLVMAAIGAWAVTTERVSYVITHGISMNPVYYQDDLVVLVKQHRYQVGQIVAYRDAPSQGEVLHRIVAGDSAGYVFKGDNNASRDPVELPAEKLIGSAFFHVPKGGVWLKPLLSPTGLGMIGFLILGAGAAPHRTRREVPRGRRKKRVKAMARQESPLSAVLSISRAIGRLSPLLRSAAALVALAAILGIVVAALGWSKPLTSTQVDAPADSRSITFSYSAKVPRSPAYDGTQAISPTPVFRKLAHRVDLRVRYQGSPGILELTATLSNGAGWHTTMQLAPPRRFSTPVHDATVALDLNALDKRAAAAAEAIGIQAMPVSIAVQARVTKNGGPPFTASLPLLLEPLQLKLANDGSSMTVVETAAQRQAIVTPRNIELSGQSVMTAAQARMYSALLLLFALFAGVAIVLTAQRKSPVRSRAEIERRFPQLLVHVEPMASPPGKPVVNVDNFPALVKLAERYGQMILTWRRPDADDFVVRDEGITYRYRIPLDEPVLQNIEHLNRPPGTGSHRRKATQEVS